jgi:hypothetical protein
MKASKIIANSDQITRNLIREYLNKTGLTLNSFCLDAKLHQSNIHTFLNGKSLTNQTIQRVASYLYSKGM